MEMARLAHAPRLAIFAVLIILQGGRVFGQDNSRPKGSPPPQVPDVTVAQTNPDEQVSFKKLPRNILRDQAFLWLRPFRLRTGDVPWAGAFFGTTAGLMVMDNNVAQGLVANPPGRGYEFSRKVGKLGTPLYGSAIMGTVYLVGLASKSKHAQATGILGIQAVADSMIIVEALKAATQRPRPTLPGGVTPNHNADGQFFTGGNSFPSGHAAGSFALATVVAERNPKRPWLAAGAYGLAGLVSVSRITERRHFPSDVFVGAVIGHLVGRHVAHRAEGDKPSVWNHLRVEPVATRLGSPGVSVNWDFR